MLSVGSRDDGRKRLGLMFGGEVGGIEGMEENELEEGEAYSGQEDDSCIDPDIAFSYIGEKLQDVLGHFQKDFEAGVSAENLGSKFGGYGSFLPSYQRSPSLLSHPKSPPRAPNQTISRSPHNSSIEGARQNPSVLTSVSITKNNNALALESLEASKGISNDKLNAGDPVPQFDSVNKPVNGTGQKTLKVRIKVGPNNKLARDAAAAAMYSGLGLEMSPSSSPENKLDGSEELSPGLHDSPDESPVAILQIMTCFSVPGGYLLSPIPENLLQLTKKECTSRIKGIPETCAVVADLALPARDVKAFIEKNTKADENNGRFVEIMNVNSKDDVSAILKSEIDNETPEGQKLVADALNIFLLSGSRDADGGTGHLVVGDSTKGTGKMLDLCKASNRLTGKERLSSPDLPQVNHLEFKETAKVSGGGNSVIGSVHSRGRMNPKIGLEEKPLDERGTSSHRETYSDKLREDSSKVEKSNVAAKADFVGEKGRKNSSGQSSEPLKQMSFQKATSCEQDGEKTLFRKKQLSEGNRKLKESQSDPAPPIEITKVSVAPKEKKSLHIRTNNSEINPKASKSYKERSKDQGKKSHRDAVTVVNPEQMENKTVLVGTNYKDKTKNAKLEHEKEPLSFTHRPSGGKLDNPQASEPVVGASINTHSTRDIPKTDVAAVSPAPGSIIDDWIECVICAEWRLLPYGLSSDDLPKDWQCSMQNWLPAELNECYISEEITSQALNALYMIPAPANDANMDFPCEVTALTITSHGALHFDQRPANDMNSRLIVGKKKPGLKDGSTVQDSTKIRSLHDVNENISETDALNNRSLKRTSKSNNYTTEKHKHRQKGKHKVEGRYADGDVIAEKNNKHSKSKSKREDDGDGFRSSKKIKKGAPHRPAEDFQSDRNVSGRAALSMDNNFPSKATGKKVQGGYTSSKDLNSEPDGHVKKSNVEVHAFTNGEFKVNSSAEDAEKPGKETHSGKKRKINEPLMSSKHMQDNGVSVKDGLSDSELGKQKKARVSKSMAKDSGNTKEDARMDEIRSTERVLKDKGVAGKENHEPDQGSSASRRALHSIDYMKRETAYAQPPAAPASSSSKVSSSRKNKVNFPEARGSPVESVSSSPLRISSTERLSTRRDSAGKGDEVDGGSNQSGTRRKEMASSVQQRSLEIQGYEESRALDSLKRSCCFPEKEANQLSVMANCNGNISNQHNKYKFEDPDVEPIRDQDQINNDHHVDRPIQRKSANGSSSHFKEKYKSSKYDVDKGNLNTSAFLGEQKKSFTSKKGSSFQNEVNIGSHDHSTYHEDLSHVNYNAQDKKCEKDDLGKKDSTVKSSAAGRNNVHSDYGTQDNLDSHDPLPKEYKYFNSQVAGASYSNFNLQENHQQKPQQDDKPSDQSFSGGIIGQSEMGSGRRNSLSFPPKAKHETESWINSNAKVNQSDLQINQSDLQPNVAVNGNEVKVVKQPRKSDSQIGLRQTIPNCSDAATPIRKEGRPSPSVMFKEAIDLKHTANRLKTEGNVVESIGLFFQAALKFLHSAFLREPSGMDSTKHGEVFQLTGLYKDTAKLCTFCAHEYEKCQNMAAAALAYKVVEVAYMKVAYYKNPTACKDQHELQATLQMAPSGESPSSSASDVDNLNNQGTLEKASSAKDTASHQIAGDHVIAACNRSNFIRLLDYFNYLNYAFEAKRKWQTAIAAASAEMGKEGIDGISSVKKVLDFSFDNVEGLLPLVRLSIESIGP